MGPDQPSQLFREESRLDSLFFQHGRFPPWRLRKSTSIKYSVVAPCYNVARYLDDFFRSWLTQNLAAAALEIICVDDGSTDNTAALIARWARRFPGRIQLVRQANQGLSAARNAGLARARGDYVSFADPDDFVARDHLLQVDKEIRRRGTKPPLLVSAHLVVYWETSGIFSDEHPQGFRFRKKRRALLAGDLKDFLQMSVNSAWIDRASIEAHTLRFDPRVVPAFEDCHFVNRLMLLEPERRVVFLPAAKYYYRKRSEQNSLIDMALTKASGFLDQLEHGHLDLLKFAETTRGSIPAFVQRTVLYSVLWNIRRVVDHPEHVAMLDAGQKQCFAALLREVLSRISAPVIEGYRLRNMNEMLRTGILGYFKNARPGAATRLFLKSFDVETGRAQFAYYAADEAPDAVALAGDERLALLHPSRVTHDFLGGAFCYEHFFWCRLPGAGEVRFTAGGHTAVVCRGHKVLGSAIDRDRAALATRQSPPANLPAAGDAHRLRQEARAPDILSAYDGCWLLMDRAEKADDNAEHLYRHLMKTGQASGKYFVLNRNSADWQRLADDGFQLLEYGSRAHVLALVNARFLISSHVNRYVFRPALLQPIGDLVHYRFVFLNHGVILSDASRWLNAKNMDLFVTASATEHESIVSYASNYKFSAAEVKLTGLPRHDSLLAGPQSADTILIMPTWRHYLDGNDNVPFAESDFARAWRSLLRAPALRDVARRSGKRLVFCPHPKMAAALESFGVGDHIECVDPRRNHSYQALFRAAAVLVTDYSSVTCEMAYLDRPSVYYQFDNREFFSGAHTFSKGYFDYRASGFGPVSETEDELLRHLERTLSGHEDPVYAERRRQMFAYRDGRCCERVLEAIAELYRPDARPPQAAAGTAAPQPAPA
jgi:glycosyltransferase involved in cell wall biosynthesis